MMKKKLSHLNMSNLQMKSTHPNTFVPPMLDGVSASKLHLPKLSTQPESIFRYLCAQFAHISAQEWQQRFEDGLVYDAEGNSLGQYPSSHPEYNPVPPDTLAEIIYNILIANT